MAYTNGSSIKKVLIDGVLHPVNDYRIEGTNFAVTQIAGDIAVGTPLTAEQLEHITEPVMSADGCVINAPALGTILIPKNVVFNPAATDDYVISYVSSPLEGKTYNLKITMDHTTGLPKEAVFAEEEVAAPPTNILKTKLDTYKTEFAKPVAERSATIVAEAKVFGNDVLSKKPNIIVELDADNQPVEVFHATESPDPTAYYRYVNGKNECIDIYYDNSTDPYTTTDLAFPDLENIYVEKAKEYMEIATTVNSVVYRTNKPVMLNEDTLGFTQVEQATQTQGTAGIIHYPKSVLFTSDSAFELKFAPNVGIGSDPYTPDAKIEISKDGLIWDQPVWDTTNGISLKADTLNPELGKYSVFIRSDNYINKADDMSFSGFSEVSGSNIEVSGILDAMWGGKEPGGYDAPAMFMGMTNLINAKNLIFSTTVGMGGYAFMFSGCTALTQAPTLLATTLTENCCQEMFSGCTSLISAPVILATTLVDNCCQEMFSGCTSLISAPALLATTVGVSCCEEMFSGCTSLISAPALPATTLAPKCYTGMFSGCTALVHAPILPATTVAMSCYEEMFSGCTSLTSAPALPAEILAQYCYRKMFLGCAALTQASAILATTLVDSCCQEMFSGCTSLISVPALLATTVAENCCLKMFSGCTSLISAPALPATIMKPACYREMFLDCTSLVSAPALPATTLAESCYRIMFSGCKALTQAPELPATEFDQTGTEACYQYMFKDCISLTKPVILPVIHFSTVTHSVGSIFVSMFEGCTGIKWATSGIPYEIKTTDGAVVVTGHTTSMFEGNGGTPLPEGSGSPKLNTTYYLEA